jgi:hypothetical protein
MKMKNDSTDIIIILTRFLLIIIPYFERDTIHHYVKFLLFYSKTTNKKITKLNQLLNIPKNNMYNNHYRILNNYRTLIKI